MAFRLTLLTGASILAAAAATPRPHPAAQHSDHGRTNLVALLLTYHLTDLGLLQSPRFLLGQLRLALLIH